MPLPAWYARRSRRKAANPQRRARVLMKFLDLVARDDGTLPNCSPVSTVETIPDAKGDIQRGVEVVELPAASRI